MSAGPSPLMPSFSWPGSFVGSAMPPAPWLPGAPVVCGSATPNRVGGDWSPSNVGSTPDARPTTPWSPVSRDCAIPPYPGVVITGFPLPWGWVRDGPVLSGPSRTNWLLAGAALEQLHGGVVDQRPVAAEDAPERDQVRPELEV